jgi:hypothetical protein
MRKRGRRRAVDFIEEYLNKIEPFLNILTYKHIRMRADNNGLMYLLFVVMLSIAAFIVLESAPGAVQSVYVSSSQPPFNFTATSDQNGSFACELSIDGIPSGGNDTVLNGTPTTLVPNVPLSEGSHPWSISCADADSVNTSGAGNIVVDTIRSEERRVGKECTG